MGCVQSTHLESAEHSKEIPKAPRHGVDAFNNFYICSSKQRVGKSLWRILYLFSWNSLAYWKLGFQFDPKDTTIDLHLNGWGYHHIVEQAFDHIMHLELLLHLIKTLILFYFNYWQAMY